MPSDHVAPFSGIFKLGVKRLLIEMVLQVMAADSDNDMLTDEGEVAWRSKRDRPQ